jgi:hypothetical protein
VEQTKEQELLERIAKARAVVAENADADRLRELEAQAVAAEREAAKAALEPSLTGSYGARGSAWDWVDCRTSPVAVRCPSVTLWQRHRDKGMPDNTEGIKSLLLDKGCLIHPSEQQFSQLEQAEPGLPDKAYVTILRLASGKSREVLGK